MSAGRPRTRRRPLDAVPPLDRRRLIEDLLRAARAAGSALPGIVAIAAYGELADRADADGVPAELLVIVEGDRLEEHRDGGRLAGAFADLPVEVRVRVEPRAGFRERIAAGDPELTAIRDRAVMLAGALPLEDVRAW